MGINADFKGSAPSKPITGKTLQPTISNQSKAAEAGGVQRHNIMATIVDDDDRLLVRIGYTPVRAR
jgi:3-deoxy-D-arabino-heptulosonate 7-phosphate (DAHP) synthase